MYVKFIPIVSYFVFVPKSSVGSLVEGIGTSNWASLLLGFAVCIFGLVLVSK